MPRGDADDYIRVSSRSRLLDDGWDETLRALESASEADEDDGEVARGFCRRFLPAATAEAVHSPLRRCCFLCGCLVAVVVAVAIVLIVASTKHGAAAC